MYFFLVNYFWVLFFFLYFVLLRRLLLVFFTCANAAECECWWVKHKVYCVISPPLINKNQNLFTLTMEEKEKKIYKECMYIQILEGPGMKNKGNNQPGGNLIISTLKWQKIVSKYIRPKHVLYFKKVFPLEMLFLLYWYKNVLLCIHPNPSATSIRIVGSCLFAWNSDINPWP